MIWSLEIILAFALLIDLLLIVFFNYNYKQYTSTHDTYQPVVSILVAAKDEEANINRCIDSLLQLSYPRDKLEILIGNDASDDNTLSLVKVYAEKYTRVKVFDITSKVGDQQGKGNVLAQLAQQVSGEYLLITDADMSLPVHWVQNMLSPMKENTGLAIGVTHVEGNRMQDLDWLYALGMVKVVTDLGLSVTGMGNNMIISKDVYSSIGGYESLPFSIIEDFELFKHVRKSGYDCVHIFQKEVLGITLSMKGFFNLLNQRKRWMRGAVQLSWQMVSLLFLQSGFYVGLLVIFFYAPDIAIFFLIGKLLLRLGFMTTLRSRLCLPIRFLSVLAYEFYSIIIGISSIFYFLLPFKVKWKGREY